MLISARCDWSSAATLASDARDGALYVLGVRSALTAVFSLRSLQNEALFCARVPAVLSRLSDVPSVRRVFMRDVSSTGRVLPLRHR